MLPFSKFGLASSVAKEQNYSWIRTVELASRFHFRQIQLYLSPAMADEAQLQLLQKVARQFKVHLHLPADAREEPTQSFLKRCVRDVSSELFLVQHQAFFEEYPWLPVKNELLTLALENDAPLVSPESFLDFFLEQKQRYRNALPVFDVSRFFMQSKKEVLFAETAGGLLDIIQKLLDANQPFILHAIDHPAHQGHRPNWKPLLEGDLPWREIFQKVALAPKLLKCLMFEYENWNMVQKSIDNLRLKKI